MNKKDLEQLEKIHELLTDARYTYCTLSDESTAKLNELTGLIIYNIISNLANEIRIAIDVEEYGDEE